MISEYQDPPSRPSYKVVPSKTVVGVDRPVNAACIIHLFHLNEVKFNFLKKLFGCLCPETECKLFADKLENGVKISKWCNFV